MEPNCSSAALAWAAGQGEWIAAQRARLLTLPGVAEAQAEAERRYAARIAALG